MLKVLFTVDYEIHGNGEGNPYDLMVEPTNRMMDLFDSYGAKLTIMADIAEILKFKQYEEQFGRDDYQYNAIAAQLRDAIRRGHDVQLHIHSSYINARFEQDRWIQDWADYNFAGLALDRMTEIVRIGKEFLEELLQPVDPNYRCRVFRAANWSVSPSKNVVRALVDNGLSVDTSVFKYGRRDGIVSFDYSNAHSHLVPWRVDEDDICSFNPAGKLTEIPIYCERRWLGAFLTPNRIYRVLMSRSHRIQRVEPSATGSRATQTSISKRMLRKLGMLVRRHAWKADFNQCTGRQLSRALRRASRCSAAQGDQAIPFVLIGHSKLFTVANGRSLRFFLKDVAENPHLFRFGCFMEASLDRLQPA